MIRDYSVYELDRREKYIYHIGGYAAIAFTCYLFYRSIILALAAGLLVRCIIPHICRHLASKRLGKLNLQFRDMLYSLSSSVSAGRQMDEAIVEAEKNLSMIYGEDEPIMMELAHMRRSIVENNESDKPLLRDFAERSGSVDIDNFVRVYITCRNMGGDVERIIGHTVEILTDKMTIEREIKALTAQKKMEGRLISLMPVAMLLVMNIFSFSYIEVLYTTAGGRIIMTMAAGAMTAGVLLMEKLSEVEV